MASVEATFAVFGYLGMYLTLGTVVLLVIAGDKDMQIFTSVRDIVFELVLGLWIWPISAWHLARSGGK